jgi:mRNA interferase RelE/StbE
VAYQVQLTSRALRDLRALDRTVQRRIAAAVNALAQDPRPPGVEKLTGEGELYRIRVGEYRIIYSIDGGRLIVLVLLIGHRRDVYDRLKRRR